MHQNNIVKRCSVVFVIFERTFNLVLEFLLLNLNI